jgi:hypothetical protein
VSSNIRRAIDDAAASITEQYDELADDKSILYSIALEQVTLAVEKALEEFASCQS